MNNKEPIKVKIEKVLDKIQTTPPLPAAVEKLCSMSRDVNIDIKGMVRIINDDPSLTAKILRVANSAFYGLSKRITTVSQATVVLGFQGVRNLALGVSVLGLWKGKGTKAVTADDFWRHNQATASACRLIALKKKLPISEEAFTAGLLHDIGKMVFVEYFSDQYTAIIELAKSSHESVIALEKKTFGFAHTEVGERLCNYWKIPDILTRAVFEHHTFTPPERCKDVSELIVAMVRLGNNLSKIAKIGLSGETQIESNLISLAGSLGITPEIIKDVLLSLTEEVKKVEVFFSLSPSTSSLAASEKDQSEGIDKWLSENLPK